MSWTTVIWSMNAGICLILAAVHLLAWLRDRKARVSLAFALWTVAVACSAIFELALMHAETPERYGELVRWIHIPLAVTTFAYILFIRLYLRGGRLSLLWSIYGLGAFQLAINFLSSPNVNFSDIVDLRHIPFWGDTIAAPVGVASPWEWIIRAQGILILLFIMDAMIAAWRQGRKRETIIWGAALLGSSIGSILFTEMIVRGTLAGPLTVSLPSLITILVMAFALSDDLTRARRMSRELEHSRQRLSLVADEVGLITWEWDIRRDAIMIDRDGRAAADSSEPARMSFERFLETVHPDDRDAIRESVERALESGNDLGTEYRAEDTDGRTRWFTVHGRIIRGGDGDPIFARGVSMDVTSRKKAEADAHLLQSYRHMGHEIVSILNAPGDLRDSMKRVLAILKSAIGVDAVGIRLRDGDDFPYFYQEGFSADFLRTENSLLKREKDDGLCRNSGGDARLDCMCGLVISGRTDPSNPLFTPGGSAWTNDSSSLLDLPADEDPRTNPRNRCFREGYLSVAMIPICAKGRVIGMLQLNSRRKGRFAPKSLEALESLAENMGEALLGKQPEKALAESEARLREAQRIAHIGNWELDLLTDKLTWSDEIFRIFEIDAAQFAASYEAFLATVHPDDRDAVDTAYLRSLRTREPYSIVHRILMRDGRVKYVQEQCENLYSPEGKPLRSMGTVQDITASKQAESERIQLRNELSHVQRVSTLGQLSSALAHELNQPLGAILNNASAAQIRWSAPLGRNEELEEILADIIADATRAGHVIRKIRGMARKEETKFERLSTNALIEEVVELYRNIFYLNGISILMDLQPELAPVKGDRVQLQQVLMNLINNAAEAMAEDSPRILRISSAKQSRDTIVVRISDSGTGLDEATKGKIFEPFFTTKKDGLGMGLRICRSIVAEHGGQIWAESNPGGGATFSFTLKADGGDSG